MAYRIVITFLAARDLQEIVRYVSEYDIETAERTRTKLLHAVELLGRFSRAGRVLSRFNDPMLREIIRRPYRIVYRIKEREQMIEIVRFWHSARGTPKIKS